jgi:hypothetical protein
MSPLLPVHLPSHSLRAARYAVTTTVLVLFQGSAARGVVWRTLSNANEGCNKIIYGPSGLEADFFTPELFKE